MARTLDDDPRPILEKIMPTLHAALGTEGMIAYRTSPADTTLMWQVDFSYEQGIVGWGERWRERWREALAAYLRTPPAQPFKGRHSGGYDPLRPEPSQRNTVWLPTRSLTARDYERIPFLQRVLSPCGVAAYDQMRVLLCDGPVMMAWLGGFRRSRFGRRERAILRAVTEPLRARMRLERRLLRADLLDKGLAAALDGTAGTALLCTRDGQVEHASAVARSRLDSDPALQERLGAALRGDERAKATCLSLHVPGLPEHVLVWLGAPVTPDLAQQLNEAARIWRLTRRQTDVLAGVVRGESNKQISERLGCVENTVEVHVSALLRKSHAQSRTALAVKFWTGARSREDRGVS